jgi:hypothetical protein
MRILECSPRRVHDEPSKNDKRDERLNPPRVTSKSFAKTTVQYRERRSHVGREVGEKPAGDQRG